MGPNIVRIAGGGSIPQLTDEQKKIVAEFKQKMALLPPNQHAQFIAAHKANLIKQLNFQPTQLQSLKGAQVLTLSIALGSQPLGGSDASCNEIEVNFLNLELQ